MASLSEGIRQALPRLQTELGEFLRIPSISARPEHQGDVRAAAQWVAGQLERLAFDTTVHDTPGHPVVLGRHMEAGIDAPTVLVYGHYDVQPVEPLDEWNSPPFEPTVSDGRIYARGSADDKGQLFLHLKAVELLLQEYGSLPLNLIFLAEGEEEVGSPNLIPFVHQHADDLACDLAVISDSAMFAPALPSLLFSLRGLAYFELEVQGPRGDLHSGSYGGGVANPANALAQIVASLHDDQGRVAIPGFYDRVVEWDPETRLAIQHLPFDGTEFLREVGSEASQGEVGYTLLERLWIRPTCDVNGMISGYTGEGAKTVLPARAKAKVSFRLVPDQDPVRVGEIFREHVRSVTPAGVRSKVTTLHGGRPWRARRDGGHLDAGARALEKAYGIAPVLTGEGGSIPIVSEFERILGTRVLLMGFAHPGANMHAPNEWFPLESLEKGTLALAYLYQEVASL